MSYPVIDYLPFDYESYMREIFPLWERALIGEVQPLKQRIQAATHFSLWPYINCPLIIETEMMERLFSNDLEPLGERYCAYQYQSGAASIMLWDILLPVLDALEAGSDPTHVPGLDLLHSSLFYTFCCDLPPEEREVWQITYSGMATDPWGGTIVLGNEDVPLWLEYIERDAEIRRLWEPFNSSPPLELIGSLLFPDQHSPDVVAHSPRCLFKYDLDIGPHGFLTREETMQLFNAYRRHETPLLAAIRDGYLRDAASDELPIDLRHLNLKRDETQLLDMRPEKATGIWTMDWYYSLDFQNEGANVTELEQRVSGELWKGYPERMKTYQQRYYETLWRVEEVVMRRVELAASRGWGVMMMQDTF
ncbi:MAG: hypothetical protein JO215_16130 [Ktedonobacteraceae bacterium]|nr:hypothetical protein [Ktedonobacteraceae bacterium]